MLIDAALRFSVLGKYSIPARSHDAINLFIMNSVIEYIIKEIFRPLIEHVDDLKTNTTGRVQIIREIKILLSKLNTVIDVFPYAMTVAKDDIFSYERKS